MQPGNMPMGGNPIRPPMGMPPANNTGNLFGDPLQQPKKN